MRELAFVLLFQDLIRPRIDLRQEVAFLDQLAFGECDIGELAVDLGLHGHRRDRRHGAERVDDFADVAGPDRRGADGLQRALRETSAGRRGFQPMHSLIDGNREQDSNQADADPKARARLATTSGGGAVRRMFGASSSSVLRVRSSMMGVY